MPTSHNLIRASRVWIFLFCALSQNILGNQEASTSPKKTITATSATPLADLTDKDFIELTIYQPDLAGATPGDTIKTYIPIGEHNEPTELYFPYNSMIIKEPHSSDDEAGDRQHQQTWLNIKVAIDNASITPIPKTTALSLDNSPFLWEQSANQVCTTAQQTGNIPETPFTWAGTLSLYALFRVLDKLGHPKSHHPALLNSLFLSAGAHYLALSRLLPGKESDFLTQNHPLFENLLMSIIAGYSLYEIYDSVAKPFRTKSITFLAHGVLVFTACWFFSTINRLHYLTDALIMETSTVFLSLRHKAMFGTPTFVITFMFYRWLIWPAMLVDKSFTWINDPLPREQKAIIATYAIMLVMLNIYWSVQIYQYVMSH